MAAHGDHAAGAEGAPTLTVLGGGGWIPAHGRETASALLRHGTHGFLIDAGTGVGRLVEHPGLLDGIDELDILLTHFHLDHVAGLCYLPALPRVERTTIWGPGKALYETPTRDLLDLVSHEPYHPVPLKAQRIDVRELRLGETELAGLTLHTRRQTRHTAPTMGIRFGNDLAWITDTAYDPEAWRFAQGCAWVAHEAWYTLDRPVHQDIHCSAMGAARVGVAAGATGLLLIHLPPFRGRLAALLAEAATLMPDTQLAVDTSSTVLTR